MTTIEQNLGSEAWFVDFLWPFSTYSSNGPIFAPLVKLKKGMYKAVFIDMDGTLLQKDHTVSDNTKIAIKKILGKGILVVPISARPLHGMLPITKQVVPDDMPVVSLNGSYIFDNNEIIFEKNISLPEVITIQKELQPFDMSAMYYSQMDWYTVLECEAILKEQRITSVKIKIQPFEQILEAWKIKNTGPNKILIAGNPELIIAIEKRLLELHSGKLNIYKSQPAYLEIMNLQASKANAIKFFMNRFGIQQNEIMAIGDNFNDKGMIEFAGIGVAMGNAPGEIKMVADYVTDTNNNDGVAKALNHFFR